MNKKMCICNNTTNIYFSYICFLIILFEDIILKINKIYICYFNIVFKLFFQISARPAVREDIHRRWNNAGGTTRQSRRPG